MDEKERKEFEIMVKRQETQVLLSKEVLKHIRNKSIQNVLREIIFNPKNTIDWDDVAVIIHKNMPELITK